MLLILESGDMDLENYSVLIYKIGLYCVNLIVLRNLISFFVEFFCWFLF